MERRDVAVVRDDHVLLRIFDRADGVEFWLLPGGGREPGEGEAECLRREVREETNLLVEVGPLLFETPDIPKGMYDRLRTYRCSVVAGEARPGSEPGVDHDGQATIRALGWLDLRDPSRWEPSLYATRGMADQLLRLWAALGYARTDRSGAPTRRPMPTGLAAMPTAFRACMAAALGRNMGIASTNRSSSGPRRICGDQSSSNAGRMWSVWFTTNSCWRIHWWRRCADRGNGRAAPPPHDRCAGRWAGLSGSLAHRPGGPNYGEKRRGERQGRASNQQHGMQSSVKTGVRTQPKAVAMLPEVSR